MIALSLGSNIGQREEHILKALSRIGQHPDIQLVRVSSLYETAPVGYEDQPAFLNAAVEIEASIEPLALLNYCLKVEQELGRVRKQKWGPRNIDIDLLLYHDIMISSDVLTLPHPYMHLRRFVLEPLAELNPRLRLASGRPIADLLTDLKDQQDVRIYKKLLLKGGQVFLDGTDQSVIS